MWIGWLKMVLYYLRERVWNRMRLGRSAVLLFMSNRANTVRAEI
jgi:uncharacterized membrane protein